MKNCFKTLLSIVLLSCSITTIATAATKIPDKQVVKTAAININTADSKALQSVKGIGKQRAEAIVAYRDDHGRFKSVNDLQNVPGVSSALLGKIKANIKA